METTAVASSHLQVIHWEASSVAKESVVAIKSVRSKPLFARIKSCYFRGIGDLGACYSSSLTASSIFEFAKICLQVVFFLGFVASSASSWGSSPPLAVFLATLSNWSYLMTRDSARYVHHSNLPECWWRSAWKLIFDQRILIYPSGSILASPKTFKIRRISGPGVVGELSLSVDSPRFSNCFWWCLWVSFGRWISLTFSA